MPQIFGQLPAAGGGGGGGGRILKQYSIPGAPITVIRPNDVLAYAAGQVYGPAADARIALVSPALPAGALLTGFAPVAFVVVQNRGGADPATPQLNGVLFRAQPATVLGDKAAFSLSDADIGLILPGNSAWHWAITGLSSGLSTGTLNQVAGPVGRRGAIALAYTVQGQVIPPATTLYLYLIMSAAYAAPLANEQLTITPYFNVMVGIL